MEQPIAQLRDVDHKVGEIEDIHNHIVDTQAELAQKQSNFLDDALADIHALREDLHLLRGDIQVRIAHAKKASVLLSLIAQQEELTPVKNRINQQQYEMYASRQWFSRLLEDGS